MLLWPQCLHDWIWYFGHGCRQRWRSLGMCDHRALWPHGCMSSSLVWVRRHGPSHSWTSPPGPLCDKPQPTTTHSQTENDNPRDSCCSLRSAVKTERFPFYCTSEGAVIASALWVGDCAAEDMSCSCQSAGQTLYLYDLRPWSIRLLLPSAGLPAAWLNSLSGKEWHSHGLHMKKQKCQPFLDFSLFYQFGPFTIFKSVFEPLQVSISEYNWLVCLKSAKTAQEDEFTCIWLLGTSWSAHQQYTVLYNLLSSLNNEKQLFPLKHIFK